MKDRCSVVSALLERYHDQEVTEEERRLIEDHLSQCPSCRDLLSTTAQIGTLIKLPIQEASERADFDRTWTKIRREIEKREPLPWWESLGDRLKASLFSWKRAWIPAMAAALIVVGLIVGPVLLEDQSPLKMSSVEYVESADYNVMIYEGEKGNVTIIWLFDRSDEEVPAS